MTASYKCRAAETLLTQAADGPIQANVIEVSLGGLVVPGIFLAPVSQGEDLLLTVLSIGVKVDLCIHAHDWRKDKGEEL